ncbi:MAG: hypothetical protein HC890_10930 [Chloroflexaceae bacterium]|nr:hypothetical protein [Chloroflexaceae bacterium]
METLSPQAVYQHLEILEKQENCLESACCREEAQEIIADPDVTLDWRQAISDRLNQTNQLLAIASVGQDDHSY